MRERGKHSGPAVSSCCPGLEGDFAGLVVVVVVVGRGGRGVGGKLRNAPYRSAALGPPSIIIAVWRRAAQSSLCQRFDIELWMRGWITLT